MAYSTHALSPYHGPSNSLQAIPIYWRTEHICDLTENTLRTHIPSLNNYLRRAHPHIDIVPRLNSYISSSDLSQYKKPATAILLHLAKDLDGYSDDDDELLKDYLDTCVQSRSPAASVSAARRVVEVAQALGCMWAVRLVVEHWMLVHVRRIASSGMVSVVEWRRLCEEMESERDAARELENRFRAAAQGGEGFLDCDEGGRCRGVFAAVNPSRRSPVVLVEVNRLGEVSRLRDEYGERERGDMRGLGDDERRLRRRVKEYLREGGRRDEGHWDEHFSGRTTTMQGALRRTHT